MEVLDFDYHPTPRSTNSGEALCFAPRQGEAARPPLSGWLLKRKSEGSRSRFLSNSNRRYFTVDWQAQQFYYSTSESNKTVSSHFAFREITSVEPIGPQGAVESDRGGDSDREELGGSASAPPPPVKRSNSKGSFTGSLIPRIPSFGNLGRLRGSEREREHGVAVRTSGSSGRVLELLCASRKEAEEWLTALKEAMALATAAGDEGGKTEASTAPGSSRRTSPSPRQSECPSASVSPRSGRASPEPSEKERSQPPSGAMSQRRVFGLLPPRPPKAGSKAGSCTSSAVGGGANNVPNSNDSTAPPAAASPSEVLSAPKAVQPEAPPSVRSRDGAGFGGAAPAPAPLAAPSDVLSAPKAPAARELGTEAWTNAKTKPPESDCAQARYGDKQVGMSLRERLQNMEFSDDEDEEEAPAAAGGGEPSPAGNASKKSPMVLRPEPKIEQLESFHAPDSDDE